MDDNSGKEVSVEVGPSGVKGSAKGYHLGNILQLVMAAVLTAGVMILYDMRAESKSTNEKYAKSATDDHEKIRQAIDKSAEAQEEMNYILTLSPDERESLGLGMPESLRRKIVRNSGFSTHRSR